MGNGRWPHPTPAPRTDLPGDVPQLPEEVIGRVVVPALGLDGLHDDAGHRLLLLPVFHDQILHLDRKAGSDNSLRRPLSSTQGWALGGGSCGPRKLC